jgi:thiol:disulfide interchange protein DsbD
MLHMASSLLLALAFAGASQAAPAAVSPTAALPAVVTDWAEGAFDQGDARVEARLLIHPERAADGSVRAGVIFTLDPGWHLYWRNPGDAGLPTRLVWSGGEASPTRWPAPAAFVEGEGTLVSYGYEGSVLLASKIQPQAGATALGVEVDALACRSSCIPARLRLERRLDAWVGAETADAVRRLFALHDESLPTPAQAFGVRVLSRRPDREQPARIELGVEPCRRAAPCAELSAPVFFPAEPGLRVVEARAAGGRVRLVLEQEEDALRPLRGVLALRGGDGRTHHLELDVAPPAPTRPFTWVALVSALALGVLGGLLLNLMPCVLPVLALKAFAVAELSGRGRREALAQGAAYAGGVLLSMLALGATVLVLRGAGHEVGWGFQLQSPGFVGAVAVLCTAFAFNLLGVFEIGFVPSGLATLGAEASGARRSFFEGLLAVALATPCSAPFLGTAVGFAFASEGPLVLAIFVAIGIGLAAPFVAICALPGAARFLPRSGPWMNDLRSLLGFALLATVVWLAWVLGRNAGVDALAGLLVLLLVVGLGAWSLGKLEGLRLRGLLVASVAGIAVLGSNWIGLSPAPLLPERATTAWSSDALAALRAEGRPVVVVFSADWCLTCKWNERNVLGSAAVEAALERGGYAVLHADWTRRDETIRQELARFGRAGVPLTLVYHAGAAEPQVLPELLSVDAVLAALDGGEAHHAQVAREADAS